MKGKKILDFYYPPIACSPEISIPLSIILNKKEGWYWFYNNYILLKGNYINGKLFHLTFTCSDYSRKCPLIMESPIERKLFSQLGDLNDLFTKLINNGYYIKLFIDRYYLAEWYGIKMHSIHDLILYGYDHGAGTYCLADYFKKGKYAFETVKQTDLIKAYDGVSYAFLPAWMDSYFPGNVYLLKYKKCNYRFSIDLFLKLISDYYDSKYTSGDFYELIGMKNEKTVFGLAVCDMLIEYIERVINHKAIETVKQFHVFYNHKIALCLCLEFLIKKKYIKDAYGILSSFEEIKKETLVIENLFIKYCLSKNNKNLYDIITLLEKIKKDEKETIRKIMDSVKAPVQIEDPVS